MFENEDLYNFVSQISSMLGLVPLIVDPEVKGTVNLTSGPIAKEDVMPLFSLILKSNNAALVRQGDVYQIVPISSALKKGLDIIEHFKRMAEETGIPYQNLINLYLRDCVQANRKLHMKWAS